MAVTTMSNIKENSIDDTTKEDFLTSLSFSAMPLSEMYSLNNIIPIMKSNSLVNGLAYSTGFTRLEGNTTIRHIYNKNTKRLIVYSLMLSTRKMSLFNKENTT